MNGARFLRTASLLAGMALMLAAGAAHAGFLSAPWQHGRAAAPADTVRLHSWIAGRVGDGGAFVADLGTLRSVATPAGVPGATLELQPAGAVTEVAMGRVMPAGYELQAIYAEVPVALRMTVSAQPGESPVLTTPAGDLLRGRLYTLAGVISAGLKWRPWFICRATERNGTNLGFVYGWQRLSGMGEVEDPQQRAVIRSAQVKDSAVYGLDLRSQFVLADRWFASVDLLALGSDEALKVVPGEGLTQVLTEEADGTYGLMRFGVGISYRF